MTGKHEYVSKIQDDKGIIHWSSDEDATWSTLYHRQTELIKTRSCEEFQIGLDIINFTKDKVPQHNDINKILKQETGWQVEPVPAIIPALDFFTLLSNKKFPAASFIRIPEELDYIQEPDIFHEFYGHCPLLTHKAYAEFMHDFGKIALSAPAKYRRTMFRLFWFTIEFGLVNTEKGIKSYGGGILSSINETVYAVESEVPKRVSFDALTCLRTPYRIDIMQPLYFVLDSFEQLFTILDQDIVKLTEEAKELGSFEPMFDGITEEL